MSNFRLEYLQHENEKKLHARKMELLKASTMLTTDPDGRVRPLYPHLEPEPPDYTADGLIDIRVEFDYGDYITAKFNEAKYKRANSLSMPTIGDKGLEALAHIEYEMSQGPEHLRHTFKVVNATVPEDPLEPVEEQ